MTSYPHIPTRRAVLGGVLVLGAACAPGRSGGGGGGESRGAATDNIRPAHRAARRQARHEAAHPQSYRLQPEAGQAPLAHRSHTSVTYTLGSGTGREIALTFDDGPHPRYTPEVLEVLRRHGVRATFCLVGKDAARYPHLLHAIADGGHQIANHSWSHPQLTRIKPGQARSQLARTSEVIARTVGTPPTLARAPYGLWNERTLAMCADLGMSPLGWSVDSRDWARPGIRAITATVMRHLRPGAIVLSHDGGGNRSQTASALDHYLPRLLERGYVPTFPP
jgi:peptidoglycan-N-acetylglucosamine deacetylase